MKFIISVLIGLFAVVQLWSQNSISGHSHNDYEQKRPLTTAFEARMGSIEADVYLVNNNLYVSHEAKDINPSKRLDELYLKPLAKLVRKKKAYPLILLIDIKSQADSTLDEIVNQIAQYSAFIQANCPIQFVISGNRPRPDKWSSYPHFIQFDGRPNENYTPEQWERIGMVSESFGKYAKLGQKDIPQETFDKMKTIVNAVHAQNKKVRFWATPDTEGVWEALAKMGVNFINTDSPMALRSFLNKNSIPRRIRKLQPFIIFQSLIRFFIKRNRHF